MSPKEKNIGSMYGSRETSTFLGLPACSDLAALDARIAIIGAGCATPYASVGYLLCRCARSNPGRDGELFGDGVTL